MIILKISILTFTRQLSIDIIGMNRGKIGIAGLNQLRLFADGCGLFADLFISWSGYRDPAAIMI